MVNYSRPIIGISKCLEFEMCRYDGSRINNNFVRNMKKFVDFVPVCPEVGIGLGTPRKPIRLVKIDGKKNLYQPSSEKNLTEEMHDFTQKFVTSVDNLDGLFSSVIRQHVELPMFDYIINSVNQDIKKLQECFLKVYLQNFQTW